MYKRFIGLTALVLVSAQPLKAADTKLNIATLNSILAKLTAEVLSEAKQQANSPFTDLIFGVVENGTDLSSQDQMSVRVTASATVNRSIWDLTHPTSLTLDVQGTADRVKKELTGKVLVQANTNTLLLGRFIATSYRDSVCGPQSTDPYDPEGKFTKRACESAKKMATAENLRVYVTAIAETADAIHDYNTSKIGQLEVQINKETDATKKQYLVSTLKSMRQQEEMTDKVRDALQASLKTGSAGFMIVVNEIPAMDQGEIDQVMIILEQASLTVMASFSSNNQKDIDTFFTNRPKVEEYLLKVQNGDPEATKTVKQVAGFYLGLVGQWVSGQ